MQETQMNETKVNNDVSVKETINSAKKIAIIPSMIAGVDAFSAACGMYKSLKEIDKDVSFVYTAKIPDECMELISSEEITSDVFERELLVSIDYSETPAARVHYSTEGDVLHLKVKPIDKNFDLSRVTSTIRGFNFDLVITIGAQSLEDLGQIYSELETEFSNSKVINIDNTELNTYYGKLNVIDATVDGLSLLALQKFVEWKYPVSKKAATAFLTGITHRNTV